MTDAAKADIRHLFNFYPFQMMVTGQEIRFIDEINQRSRFSITSPQHLPTEYESLLSALPAALSEVQKLVDRDQEQSRIVFKVRLGLKKFRRYIVYEKLDQASFLRAMAEELETSIARDAEEHYQRCPDFAPDFPQQTKADQYAKHYAQNRAVMIVEARHRARTLEQETQQTKENA